MNSPENVHYNYLHTCKKTEKHKEKNTMLASSEKSVFQLQNLSQPWRKKIRFPKLGHMYRIAIILAPPLFSIANMKRINDRIDNWHQLDVPKSIKLIIRNLIIQMNSII